MWYMVVPFWFLVYILVLIPFLAVDAQNIHLLGAARVKATDSCMYHVLSFISSDC
jgi:hypothetical protein